MEYKDKSLFAIHIDYYKAITKCDGHFSNTEAFDRSCGIRYVSVDQDEVKDGILCFYFTVVDERKYLLAKIKYSI
jgi:hypothetical protein